jgi:hypothetical protein
VADAFALEAGQQVSGSARQRGSGDCVILLAMLNRRTIWLLAAVMALGSAYAVPRVCAERGAEVCAIVCRVEQRCEKLQQAAHSADGDAEVAPLPFPYCYQPIQTPRFEWPASYQRPPTQSL